MSLYIHSEPSLISTLGLRTPGDASRVCEITSQAGTTVVTIDVIFRVSELIGLLLTLYCDVNIRGM